MDYMKITINDIIDYCKAHGEVDWLKAKAKETTISHRHTGRIKTTNSNGKTVWIVDKNSPIEEVEMPISFIEIKSAFVDKFMPEIRPKRTKTPSMYELIANL